MLLSTTGCGIFTATKPVIDDCNLFSPIYPSRLDTIETRRQVYEHDRIGQEKCKWVGYDGRV